jgi:hypothetical protein
VPGDLILMIALTLLLIPAVGLPLLLKPGSRMEARASWRGWRCSGHSSSCRPT